MPRKTSISSCSVLQRQRVAPSGRLSVTKASDPSPLGQDVGHGSLLCTPNVHRDRPGASGQTAARSPIPLDRPWRVNGPASDKPGLRQGIFVPGGQPDGAGQPVHRLVNYRCGSMAESV